jgi:flagellar hook assembly protein FlgD
MVSSSKPVAGIDTITGKISIYDPLGLPVVKDERCSVSKSRDKIFFIWNGSNKKGRIVGNGIYSAIVNVSVSTGAKSTLKTKIGVLHGKN